MTDETSQSHQGGNAADAQTGGGPSTERGGRDAGMPGPTSGAGASSEATGGSEHYADSTETEATGTGSTDVAPTQSATEEATIAVTDPDPTS
jgi:hypothetical protein